MSRSKVMIWCVGVEGGGESYKTPCTLYRMIFDSKFHNIKRHNAMTVAWLCWSKNPPLSPSPPATICSFPPPPPQRSPGPEWSITHLQLMRHGHTAKPTHAETFSQFVCYFVDISSTRLAWVFLSSIFATFFKTFLPEASNSIVIFYSLALLPRL